MLGLNKVTKALWLVPACLAVASCAVKPAKLCSSSQAAGPLNEILSSWALENIPIPKPGELDSLSITKESMSPTGLAKAVSYSNATVLQVNPTSGAVSCAADMTLENNNDLGFPSGTDIVSTNKQRVTVRIKYEVQRSADTSKFQYALEDGAMLAVQAVRAAAGPRPKAVSSMPQAPEAEVAAMPPFVTADQQGIVATPVAAVERSGPAADNRAGVIFYDISNSRENMTLVALAGIEKVGQYEQVVVIDAFKNPKQGTVMLWEIDCENRLARIVQSKQFDEKSSGALSKSATRFTPMNSNTGAFLYKAACRGEANLLKERVYTERDWRVILDSFWK
jgi:hypothetical protein